MKKIKKWKVLVFVILLLVVLRVLLFESVSIRGYLKFYYNHEKYEEHILAKQNYYVFNFALFGGEDWKRYQCLFMFQWEYNALINEIREDLYEELDALVENYESVSGYEVNEKIMTVGIYYSDSLRDEEVDGRNLEEAAQQEVLDLCLLWYRFVHHRAPKRYEAEVLFWRTSAQDDNNSEETGTELKKSLVPDYHIAFTNCRRIKIK